MTNRETIQAQFCGKTVDDLTEQDLRAFVYNVIMDTYTANYDDDQFEAEVDRYFPWMLER